MKDQFSFAKVMRESQAERQRVPATRHFWSGELINETALALGLSSLAQVQGEQGNQLVILVTMETLVAIWLITTGWASYSHW